jgi:hypothetical protein
VAIALRSWFGAGGSSKWEAEEEKDIDTGVFTGVWKRATLDSYGGWDDGWPVNQDSELAARFFERGSRIVCVPELGALYTPRDSLESLWRQYWRYGYYRAKTSYHPTSMRRPPCSPGLVMALRSRCRGRCASRAAVGVRAAGVVTAARRRREQAPPRAPGRRRSRPCTVLGRRLRAAARHWPAVGGAARIAGLPRRLRIERRRSGVKHRLPARGRLLLR